MSDQLSQKRHRLVNERLAQVECVLDEADVGGLALVLAQDDFDDVEPEVDRRAVEESKVAEGEHHRAMPRGKCCRSR